MTQRALHEEHAAWRRATLADWIAANSGRSGPGSELARHCCVGTDMDPKSSTLLPALRPVPPLRLTHRQRELAASSTAAGWRSSRTPSKSYTRRTAAHPAGRTVSPNAKTILVVEDAKDTRDFFVVALSDAGYRVLNASSVSEALRLLRVERSVDAIVADYNLGDGSGAALIHQARNEGLLDEKGTPALICTAYRYVELPPNVAIIHKPIGEAELLRKIAYAFDGTLE